MESQILEQKAASQQKLSNPDGPITLRDKLILSPGMWNGINYTAAEIEKAFLNTDWNEKSITHLYLDHKDTKDQGVGNWAGFIKNPRMVGSDLRGDLEIWHPLLATFLDKAGAKFGISATLSGFENELANQMQNFHYESFSVVIDPARDLTFINLSKNKENNKKIVMVTLSEESEELALVTGMEGERKTRGMSPSQFYAAPRDPPSSSALPIFDKAHTQNAMARFNQTQFKSSAEKASAKRKIISAANKFGIKISDSFKQLSDVHIELKGGQKIMTSETKKLEDEKVEEKKEEAKEEISEASEESKETEKPTESEEKEEGKAELKELSLKVEKLISLLEKKFLSEEKESETKESTESTESKEPEKKEAKEELMDKLKNELDFVKKELSKLNEPDRKTLSVTHEAEIDSNEGMLGFLQNRIQ